MLRIGSRRKGSPCLWDPRKYAPKKLTDDIEYVSKKKETMPTGGTIGVTVLILYCIRGTRRRGDHLSCFSELKKESEIRELEVVVGILSISEDSAGTKYQGVGDWGKTVRRGGLL